MKNFTAIVAFILLASPAVAQSWTRITTEQGYRDTVVGRPITVEGQGVVTWMADGTGRGEWGGHNLVGAWTWSNGYQCRNVRVGTHETGTDCHRVEVNGNQIRVTTERGNGRTIVGTLGPVR